MEVQYNNKIPISEWNDFLNRNTHASPFQSHVFFSFINSVKNLSAEAISVTQSGSIKALAVVFLYKENGLRGYFSRRGIMYGGPLIENGYQEALEMLLQKINERLTRRVIYIEIRNFSDYENYKKTFSEFGFRYTPYLNIKVPTSDREAMYAAVSSSRKRQIRKAEKNSVIWKEADDESEVIAFYKILKQLYIYRIGKPLPGIDFFIQFFRQKIGKYLIILYEGKIIGGIMCPVLKNKTLYEFFICGLDEEFREQYPSVMATWAAMEYAFRNNFQVFDFMGAGKPGEKYGVRDFKERFGGEMVEYGRFIKVNMPLFYNIGKSGLKVSKWLK